MTVKIGATSPTSADLSTWQRIVLPLTVAFALYALPFVRIGKYTYGMGGTTTFVHFFVPLLPQYLDISLDEDIKVSVRWSWDEDCRVPYIPSFNQSRLVM